MGQLHTEIVLQDYTSSCVFWGTQLPQKVLIILGKFNVFKSYTNFVQMIVKQDPTVICRKTRVCFLVRIRP